MERKKGKVFVGRVKSQKMPEKISLIEGLGERIGRRSKRTGKKIN